MRIPLLIGLMLVPLGASAAPVRSSPRAPLRDVIWGQAPARTAAVAPRASGITTISHLIYMNNCLPNGCALHPGADDALNNQSSIATDEVTLSAWSYGDAAWADLVACVQATYAPFDIKVTDVDPGGAAHSEIMVAGHAAELNTTLTNAGGVAPFLGCGALYDDTISFMFAEDDGDQLDYLCGGVAQETSHVFGLDHELNADDPMTYLDLGSHKTFQNADAQCGETAGMPRECYSLADPSSPCAGPTQNSYEYLMDHFGPAVLNAASMSITTPADGAYVKQGFAVQTMITDQLSIASARLEVDGTGVGPEINGSVIAFTAPTTLSGGAHAITVTAMDQDARPLTATVNVKVLAACSATSPCTMPDTGCLDGVCTPLADVAGGLGATCTTNGDCIPGSCGTDGTSMLCTGACDATNVCPSGFDCLSSGASGVCWPAPPVAASSGGCSTTGGQSSTLMLAGLAALIAARRRARA